MAPRDLRTRFARRAAKSAVFVPDDLLTRLLTYYALLERWNRKINLTSLDDPDEAIDRLLIEPLVAARHLPAGASLIDIGSGGGSPAIPLALTLGGPLTMVESKARKSAFLSEATRQLHLMASVETSRYEELLARPELHEAFDVLSLRAVRVEARVLTSLQAFVKPSGLVAMFRGPSGPDAPAVMVPPLEWVTTVPLVEPLQSRLTLLRKLR